MCHGVVQRRKVNFILFRINDYRSHTPVFKPVGASLSVQYHVPVHPAIYPAVHTTDDIPGIAIHRNIFRMQTFLICRCPVPSPIRCFFRPIPFIFLPVRNFGINTGFCLNEVFIRSLIMGKIQGFGEPVNCAAIPVNSETIEVFGGGIIFVHHPCPFFEGFPAVLVIRQHFYIMFIGLQSGTKVVMNEIHHFFGSEDHAFPIITTAKRFIFNGYSPNINSFLFIFGKIFRDKQRPTVIIFG